MSDVSPRQGRSGLTGLAAKIEHIFEQFLWYFRLVIVLGVVGLLLGSSVVFILGILETSHLVVNFFTTLWKNDLHLPVESGLGLMTYNDLILSVIKIVDDFLVGIVLLIFGLGSYDLFVSRIDPHATKMTSDRWLVFSSLEELKSVLGKVVLMILTITFLQVCINMEFSTPLDLMYLGGGIAFVSLGLRLTLGKDINRTTIDSFKPEIDQAEK